MAEITLVTPFFLEGKGYKDLVDHIESNPKFVFAIEKTDAVKAKKSNQKKGLTSATSNSLAVSGYALKMEGAGLR